MTRQSQTEQDGNRQAGKVKVEKSGRYPDIEYGYIHYQERGDGWYIRKEDENGYRKFASISATERTLRQLVFKTYCQSYGGEWEDNE